MKKNDIRDVVKSYFIDQYFDSYSEIVSLMIIPFEGKITTKMKSRKQEKKLLGICEAAVKVYSPEEYVYVGENR